MRASMRAFWTRVSSLLLIRKKMLQSLYVYLFGLRYRDVNPVATIKLVDDVPTTSPKPVSFFLTRYRVANHVPTSPLPEGLTSQPSKPVAVCI